jgi:hypothetical protein
VKEEGVRVDGLTPFAWLGVKAVAPGWSMLEVEWTVGGQSGGRGRGARGRRVYVELVFPRCRDAVIPGLLHQIPSELCS